MRNLSATTRDAGKGEGPLELAVLLPSLPPLGRLQLPNTPGSPFPRLSSGSSRYINSSVFV